MNFADGQLYCPGNGYGAGADFIGAIDIKGEVDNVDNQQYDIMSEETNRGDALVALGNALAFEDVYTGLRVYFTL